METIPLLSCLPAMDAQDNGKKLPALYKPRTLLLLVDNKQQE